MSTQINDLLIQASEAEQAKNWPQAEKLYRQILSQVPKHPEASYSLAFMYMRHGHAKPAWKFIQAAKETYQNIHSFWFQYAQIALKVDHFNEALDAIQKAIKLEPQVNYFLCLAQVQIQLEQALSAIESLQEVLKRQKENQLAHHYLGALYLKQDQNEEARYHLEQAVKLNPNDVESLNNLGFAYLAQNNEAKAEAIFTGILASKPDFIAAIEGIVQIYLKQNKKDLAIQVLERALTVSPGQIVSMYHLQNINEIETNKALNIAYCKYKLTEDPSNLDYINILLKQYASQGDFEEARIQLKQLQKALPEHQILKLASELLLPLMGHTTQEQEDWHQKLEQTFNRWLMKDLQFEDTELDYFILIGFYAYTYQTRGDGRRFREKWVKFFESHFSQWEAEANPGEPHIGFLVTKGHEGIFIKSMAGILNRLNLTDFKVTIFASELGYEQIIQPKLEQAKIKHIPITQKIPEIAETVRQAKCDILNFWEIGTDTQNFFLPFYRLAPVQTLGWGWPMTSGNPKVDYYFSSQHFEIDTADDFYTEKLLRFRGLSSYYFRPQLKNKQISRGELGLPENKRLYFCSQTILKLHPDFDEIVFQILERDSEACIYFLLSKFSGCDQFFEKRLKTLCGKHSERIFFLKRRPFEEYLQLISVMDLMLDPFHYVGANTTLDAFSVGVPVITLPTNYQRGRFTYAAYQEMGIHDAIAQNPEHYIELVEHFGKNREARQDLSQNILAKCDILFENPAVVEDYQNFFEQTLRQIRS